MLGRLHGLRPLLRIARRDALRAKGRSALVIAMVAVPLLGICAGAVLLRTFQLDPDEEVARELGRTAYRIEVAGLPGTGFVQAPDPGDGNGADGDLVNAALEAGVEPIDPLSALPSGARALTAVTSSVDAATRAGSGEVSWTEAAAADPAFSGRWLLLEGRAPAGPAEVLLSPGLLERTGLALGGTLVLTAPAAEFTVVGVARQVGERGEGGVIGLPGALVGAAGGIDAASVTPTVYVDGVEPLTWPEVQALNEQGLSVFSRTVVLSPPADAEVPYYAQFGKGGDGTGFLELVLLAALIGGLAGLEVVLLAGAAFAVGARRQARSLALVAAAGGTSRHVRAVVLGGGLVLGLAGGLVGVLGGVGVAAATIPLFEAWGGEDAGRLDPRPLELLVIVVLGVGTGLLAAALPARTAARQDVVAALRGRRGQMRTPLRVPMAGMVVTTGGVALAAAGSFYAVAVQGGAVVSSSQSYLVAGLIAGGAGLAVIGLVILSPAVIGLVGRLARWLPLAPRLALRDAARNRGRSAPALAAVLAAVSGSVGLLLFVSSVDDSDRRSYLPDLPAGTAGVSLQTFSADGSTIRMDPEPVRQATTTTLPVASTVLVRSHDSCATAGCRYFNTTPAEGKECPSQPFDAPVTDPRCRIVQPGTYTYFNSDIVADTAEVEALYGDIGAPARAALDAGGVLTLAQNIAGGATRIEVQDVAAHLNGGTPPPLEVVELPAASLADDRLGFTTVLSSAAAERLGADVVPSYLLLHLERLPTQDEEDAATAAVADISGDLQLIVERGYTSDYGPGLLALVVTAAVVTLGAAGVATGLAQADSRADHATLAAVGAAPRLRRHVAAFQALVIALLGTALGIAAGFVPAVALVGALSNLRLVWPWEQLLIVLVVIPLIAGAGAWLCVRSRLPLERRMAA